MGLVEQSRLGGLLGYVKQYQVMDDIEYCATNAGCYLAVVERTALRGRQDVRRVVTEIKADPELPASRKQHWALWRIRDREVK